MTSYKIWALLGAAGGVGFGLFAAPLIYILANISFDGAAHDGVTLGQTIRFAIGNGVAWGVLGLFAGVFFWLVNAIRQPNAED